MSILRYRDRDGSIKEISAIRGAPGKSAYEYARDGGYSGTEEDFYNAMANIGSDFEKMEADILNLSSEMEADILNLSGEMETAMVNLSNDVEQRINQIISEQTHFRFERVDILPESGAENVIYLVYDAQNNIYMQYLFVNGVPEMIGDTQIDLSGYISKGEFNDLQEEFDNFKKEIQDKSDADVGYIRKLLAVTSGLFNLNKKINSEVNRNTCRVKEVGDYHVKIFCNGEGFNRSIRINTNIGNFFCYEITRISNAEIRHSALYSTTTEHTTKILKSLWIDGQFYQNIDILKTENFSFRTMVLSYEVLINSKESCLVTLVVTANGFRVYETVSDANKSMLNKFLIEGDNVQTITTHGKYTRVFSMKGDNKINIENIYDNGNTIIKDIRFDGGV